MGVTDVSKRILLGRKLRSTQLGETLLPKRVALPVFASDALSSVAYAPDEIFIMLSLAGVSYYVWSWKIALLVALVMSAVVASYRQTVHAYPSGGGDYEVATVKWTADQVMRRILPAGAEPDFRDPSGTIRVDALRAGEAWIGNRTVDLQQQSGSRIAWIDRLGEGMLPTRETVIQEGDVLHLVMREENADRVYSVLENGPEAD